jgi:threonine dehydratase
VAAQPAVPISVAGGAAAMNDLPVTIANVRHAATAITGAIAHTPVIAAPALSELAGTEIHLKLETLHRTGSFKERGALNKLLRLDPNERRAGVVAMSAGNHAQGVAYHAQRLGIPATIVMPEGTPFIKIDRTEAFGARVVLKGDSLSAARQAADALAREQGLVLVHPYDDPAVIAGQGTIALELLADRPELDTIVVPVGGGGLISGIAVAAKGLNPQIEIVGVQSTLYPSMYRLMRGEDPGPPAAAATLAEGIAVKEPGRLTRRIVKALVSEILLVDDVSVERAIETSLEQQKLVIEGAGAAGLAAVLATPGRFRGRRVGIVICGGNIDARLLASILMRGLVREGRLVRLRSELPDMPGALSRLSGVIGKHAGNIVEVHHQRLFHDTSVKRAELDVVVETQNRRHVEVLIAALVAAGFPTQLLPNTGEADREPEG